MSFLFQLHCGASVTVAHAHDLHLIWRVYNFWYFVSIPSFDYLGMRRNSSNNIDIQFFHIYFFQSNKSITIHPNAIYWKLLLKRRILATNFNSTFKNTKVLKTWDCFSFEENVNSWAIIIKNKILFFMKKWMITTLVYWLYKAWK